MMYYTCRIDTNRYAGSFERPMCAFITGQIGECEVGRECMPLAEAELTQEVLEWFGDHIIQVSDGCDRPVEIAPTPGLSAYQSIQIRFNVEPPDWILAIVRERAFAFPDAETGYSYVSEKLEVTDVVFSKVEEITTPL